MDQLYPTGSFGGAQTLANIFLTILQNGESETFSNTEKPTEVIGTQDR